LLQGADFGAPARNRIEDKLRSGMTLAQIEDELTRHGQPQQQERKREAAKQEQKQPEAKQEQKQPEAKQEQKAAAAPPPPPPPAPAKPAEVGQSLGTTARNPLQMIKVGKGGASGWRRTASDDPPACLRVPTSAALSVTITTPPAAAAPQKQTAAPSLSEDKRAKQIKPLEFLVQRAAGAGPASRAVLRALQQAPGGCDSGAVGARPGAGVAASPRAPRARASRPRLSWLPTRPQSTTRRAGAACTSSARVRSCWRW
jgi:hypothetical protein